MFNHVNIRQLMGIPVINMEFCVTQVTTVFLQVSSQNVMVSDMM